MFDRSNQLNQRKGNTMSIKNIKKFAKQFDLEDQISVDDKGIHYVEDYYKKALEKADIGVSPEQVLELQKFDRNLYLATALTSTEKLAEYAKENEVTNGEFSGTYVHGSMNTSVILNVGGDSPTTSFGVIEHKYEDADGQAVTKEIEKLIGAINS